MLVLSRKKNESISINDDIVIAIVDIRGDKVRLGIELDKYQEVHRTEVAEAIKRNEGIQKPRQTVMLTAKAQEAVRKLARDVTVSSSSPNAVLEAVLLKAAGM